MRRFLPLAAFLSAFPAMAGAQAYTNTYWQLLAIDGVATEFRATLRIDTDNVLAGAAPCNRWMAHNGPDLPALLLGKIRSTRMACDRMADETVFFDALARMTEVALNGARNLILTGPDGHRMEFIPEGSDPGAEACLTCPPKD